MKRTRMRWAGILVSVCVLAAAGADMPEPARPNIVYILCDDLGYGDVHALGGERSRIPTPNMDRLAAEGMVFTDAHSGSSVCTPTRYGILTGRYGWRTRLQNGVLHGYSDALIDRDRLTVPGLLRQQGYATACMGKWHLGTGVSKSPRELAVTDGPVARGFDTFFGVTASADMPPFAYVEDDHLTQAPTTNKTWLRKGPAAPDFDTRQLLGDVTRRSAEYIRASATGKKPYFLYVALTSPHTPILPAAGWEGRSGLNAYADFVMQTDDAVGQILEAIEITGRREDTLVIFTSDNGCSPAANVEQLEARGHFPSGTRRGYKADIWEGGHRVPFIARWPGHVRAGTRSDQLVCLTDLMATCAEVVGIPLPANAGEDSVSFLPALLGTATNALREAVVHHSIEGAFAIRQGPWKLCFTSGSGGWGKGVDTHARGQLYNLEEDPGERHNRFATEPALVARLTERMETYIADGRSTPGAPARNDVAVKLWKNGKKQSNESDP